MTNRPSFDRAAFMAAATDLLEETISSGALGLGPVPVRELTARQRLNAVELATMRDGEGKPINDEDGTAKIDAAMYWAALIQMSVLDPESCEWDDEGNTVPGTGKLLLKPTDVPRLAMHGREALQFLAEQIQQLSRLTKESLFRVRQEFNDRQRGAATGAGESGGGADAGGAGDGGDGTPVGDGAGGGEGDDAEPNAQPDGVA